MDLLKAPSNLSLVDSDVGSIDSLPFLEFEDLNDEEYGIPAVNELPSLESVLACDEAKMEEWETSTLDSLGIPTPSPSPTPPRNAVNSSTTSGSLLKYVFLQGISQQITAASERIGAGVGSAVAVWGERIAIGTSHGLVMAFAAQALRWCCQQHREHASVTTLDYNEDGTRLLAGFARGIVVMYESCEGTVLRQVEACGGGPWGVLRACWTPAADGGASNAAVVADTGGSVWLLRFTRTLGVRSSKVSCLFSGARGEVCAVEPGWDGALALATLSRVVVVWGGSSNIRQTRAACQALLSGPSDSLPLLSWQPPPAPTATRRDPVLCSARGSNIQFHQVRWGTTGPEALPLKRAALPWRLAALRWLGARRLALLDDRETLHLWDVSSATVLETLDLSNAQLIYANAHFKGVATGGKVSEALSRAGCGALGGAAAGGGLSGALLLLGRAGLHRVGVRAAHAAAHHHADMGRWVQALETMTGEYNSLEGKSSRQAISRHRAEALLIRLASDPLQLGDSTTALATIDACVQMQLLDILWGPIWDGVVAVGVENCVGAAAGRRAAEGSLPRAPTAVCQHIVSQLVASDPQRLQKALLHLPVDCMDLHQVLTECRRLGLWEAWVRVTSSALRDPPLPLKDLLPLVGGPACRKRGELHNCPGDALLLYVADCFAGRDFPRGLLPPQDRPSIRHEILGCLLYDGDDSSTPLPHLRALLLHDAGSTLRMLGMAFTEPPFMGPMGKRNRLKMTMSLHNVLQTAEDPSLFTEEEIAEVVLFTATHLANGSLPPDTQLITNLKKHFSTKSSSLEADILIEKAWLTVLTCTNGLSDSFTHSEIMGTAKQTKRLKVVRHLLEKLEKYDGILETFLNDVGVETDLFLYLENHTPHEERQIGKQVAAAADRLVGRWPERTARFLVRRLPELIPVVLAAVLDDSAALVFMDMVNKLGAADADTSAKHLNLLCRLRPDAVLGFLDDPPSVLRPEAALDIIRKRKITAAEPKCLEATGDLSAALDASVSLMLNAPEREERERLAAEACALCTRAAKVSGPTDAESLWKRLIEGVADLPEAPAAPLPALLLEGAARHLPLPWLVARLCGGGGHTGALRGALTGLLEAARGGAEAVSAASRLTGSELHAALATALRARRILPVPLASCATCHNPLHSKPLVRAYCCGHAFHLECDPVAGRCGRCGQIAGEIRSARPSASAARPRSEPPQQFPLYIVAPPRPDLEGVI